MLLLRYAESLDAESVAAKLGQEVASVKKFLGKAFDEFLRVLRERGWIRMRGGWWYSRNCTLHPVNEKKRREAQWQLVKWPGNVNEAHHVIGVSLTASFGQKRIAYLKMLRVHHPDVAFTFGPDARYRAEDVMKKVNRAWEMICAEQEQWG